MNYGSRLIYSAQVRRFFYTQILDRLKILLIIKLQTIKSYCLLYTPSRISGRERVKASVHGRYFQTKAVQSCKNQKGGTK